MKLDTTDLVLSFKPDRIVPPFSWVGHIPFLAQLLKTQQPRCFVELGTHSGNSYLAACQAIKEYNLPTQCYAVDTWQGDEQAGFYDNEVYEQLCDYHDVNYNRFSTLLRMTFDDALAKFGEGSIDLLHIDGLHTYEAVKHDFETWLPKMSHNGIIMFHDTEVKSNNFGVWKLWDEITSNYAYRLNFHHSNGLGVLFLSEPEQPLLQSLIQGENNDLVRLFADAGDCLIKTSESLLKLTNTEKALEYKQSELNSLYEEFKQLQQLYEDSLVDYDNKEREARSLVSELSALIEENKKLERFSPHIKIYRWLNNNLFKNG